MAERGPELEPQLLVPPHLTQRALASLKDAALLPTHWQRGGRYGSRIAVELAPEEGQRPRRTIPVLPAAAEGISAFLAAAAAEPGAQAAAASTLPPALQAVLRADPHIALQALPRTAPRLLRPENFDATVHPERAPGAGARPEAAAGAVKFRFAELFAGLGGFAVGLSAIGGDCVFASEVAPGCRALYRRNFPDTPLAGDIWGVASSDIPDHDLLVGGFPCQPFSTLGPQRGLADTKPGPCVAPDVLPSWGVASVVLAQGTAVFGAGRAVATAASSSRR